MKRMFAAAVLAAATLAQPALADDDLVRVEAKGDVAATMDALEQAVTAAGATVFARVDHSKGAQSVGMDLAPEQLGTSKNCPDLTTAV